MEQNIIQEIKDRTSITRQWLSGKRPVMIIVLLIVTLASAFLWRHIVITVNSGEAGVLFRRFTGTEIDKVYAEGVHIISPIDIMYIYETRNQIALHEFDVLSVKGLRINLAMAIRYRPEYDLLGILHQRIGPDYLQRVILPQIESVMRKQLGTYNAEQIYTNEGGLLNNTILRALDEVGRNFVEVEDIIIRNLTLPNNIVNAIEDKLTQQELLRSYEFRLEITAKEAERMIREATGINQYQRIVGDSLTPEMLAYEGIKATKELAKSQNAKIVVIGSGEKGLPLILGDQAFTANNPNSKQGANTLLPDFSNPGNLPAQ